MDRALDAAIYMLVVAAAVALLVVMFTAFVIVRSTPAPTMAARVQCSEGSR